MIQDKRGNGDNVSKAFKKGMNYIQLKNMIETSYNMNEII